MSGASHPTLFLRDDGPVDAIDGYRADQHGLALAAGGAIAARTWTRTGPCVSLGRFHRHPGGSTLLERRLTGGRCFVAGDGVLGVSVAFPSVQALEPGGTPLRPDQILNRALRPLLASLRDAGVDAFYPGRDLVTVAGRTVAHAAFTVTPDGVVLVEAHVAVSRSPGELATLLASADPDAVVGADRHAMAASTTTSASGGPSDTAALAKTIGRSFATAFAGGGAEPWPAVNAAATTDAFEAFTHERGPVAEGARVAAALTMLGAAEASAVVDGDRFRSLELTGDFLAPFATVEAIARRLEGEPARMPSVRRALVAVLSQPRSFLLGWIDPDEAIGRLIG